MSDLSDYIVTSGDLVCFQPTPPPDLAFFSGGTEIVRFTADGKVEVNPKYSADEAAKAFWECVRENIPWRPEAVR